MKTNFKVILTICSLLLLVVFQNCSNMESLNSNEETASEVQLSGATFNSAFDKVLSPQCVNCHSSSFPSGSIDLSSYEAILNSGTVVPGDLEKSSLYVSMSKGAMPPAYPVSNSDLALIGNWILDGARDSQGLAYVPVPVVKAGDDIYIYEPTNSVQLAGVIDLGNASVKSITWSQISGPKTLTIVEPNSLKSVVSGITNLGTYELELIVVNDRGGEATDRLVISLNPNNNLLPMVSAGLDKNIQIPTNSVTIKAIAADQDGAISSYNWRQTGGPVATTLLGSTTPNLTVNNITTIGSYSFEITVSDNDGATAKDIVNVVLDPAPVAQSFADINDKIFKPKCLSCHFGGNARGGYDMNGYAKIMTLVVVNNANASLLYQRCYDNTMPPGKSLTKTEKDKIRDWINTGALNN
ncbi:MAG: hypothetical protein KDD40_06310 [Bdellovibrionales bacterium]|nr:hypothetical protein [Bdellovibrionales bacterium]